MMRRTAMILGCLLVASCQRKAPNYGPSEAEVKIDRLGKLRNEIAALTPPRGCQKVSECKAHPLGYNRCGGPRQFVVYCSQGVDGEALQRKSDELHQLEEEEAKSQGEPPPCKKAVEPQVELVDGSCRSK